MIRSVVSDDAGVAVRAEDGSYRAIGFKAGAKLYFRSCNDNDFKRYSGVLKGLAKLPNETVIDGAVVAFDADG